MEINTLQEITTNFAEELKLSNDGKKTSLPYIKSIIPSRPLIAEDEKFQVIVIGGSIFRSALIQKDSLNIKIIKVTQKKLPPFPDKDTFLKFISENLEENIRTLAINFAYALQPIFEDGKLDGILLDCAKGNLFKELLHQRVGKNVENYLRKKHGRKVKVTLANDSICLLLSGLAQYKAKNLAAGIVGSGINFAIFSDNNTVINLEAGNFDKFVPASETIVIDFLSQEKGKYLFEKEAGGFYLYKHFNYLMKKKDKNFIPLVETAQLSKLALKNRSKTSDLAKNLLAHSAQLVACEIAGIVKFKKISMTFIMQGSLFWIGYNYKKVISEALEKLIPEFKVKFIYIDNSDILGAAKLVV